MIHHVSVVLKEIFLQGREYVWPRPERCLRCDSDRVWGHGFVERMFEGFSVALLIKRYRCPVCGGIIVLRPDTHFSCIQTPIKEIRFALSQRIETGRWPTGLSPPLARHWLKNLRRNSSAYLSDLQRGLITAFDSLIKMDRIPVCRSI